MKNEVQKRDPKTRPVNLLYFINLYKGRPTTCLKNDAQEKLVKKEAQKRQLAS